MSYVNGIADGEAEVMARAVAGIEIKLLAAGAIAAGDDAGVVRLSGTFYPGLDGEGGVVGEGAEIDALDVADVAIGWAKRTKADGGIGIVRIIAWLIERGAEILGIVTAPAVVGNRAIRFVEAPIGDRIIGENGLGVADGGIGKDGEGSGGGIREAENVADRARVSGGVSELNGRENKGRVGSAGDGVGVVKQPLVRKRGRAAGGDRERGEIAEETSGGLWLLIDKGRAGRKQAIDVDSAGKGREIDFCIGYGGRDKFGISADGIARRELFGVPEFVGDILSVVGAEDAGPDGLISIAGELMRGPENAGSGIG